MKKKKLLVSVLCAAAVVGLSGAALTSCKKDDGDKPGETETEQVTVTFNTGTGASTVASKKVNKGEATTKPVDPTKAGYVFGGWYTDAACSDSKKFNFSTTLDADITLYAKWTAQAPAVVQVTVTYNAGEGASTVAAQKVNKGAVTTKPEDPTKEGYIFDGWYTDEACGDDDKFDFTTKVDGDLTLYAKWIEEKVTVTFVTGTGGSSVEAQEIKKGATATKPADPTKANCEFEGWYTNEECSADKKYDFASAVDANLTLYANWIEKTTVTFNTGEGASTIEAQVINRGTAVTKPADPTKEGYVFLGWFDAAEEDANEWDFTQTISGSTKVLYAHWRVLTEYDKLLNKGNVVINDDFNSKKADDVLADFSEPGTKGLYQLVNVKNGAGDKTSNHVAFDGDTAHLVDTSEGGTQLIIDFGKELDNGVVEGAFDLTIISNKNGWTFLQLYGSDAAKTNSEVFGFRADSKKIKYRLDGGSIVEPETAVDLADITYRIYFKADLETGKLTVTINGVAFVTDGAFGITGLSYIKLVSSDGGQATMKVDNLIVRQDEIATADYITKMKNKLAAVIEKLNLDVNYTVNKETILGLQTSGNAEMEAKQDNDGVYQAYVAVLAQIKEVPNDTEQALLNAQNTAIETLQSEYNTNQGNYTYTENSAAYEKALADGIALIQATATEAEIPAALTAAQELLAAVDTDAVALQKMKVAAVEELAAYKQADDYSKYQSTQYQELLNLHTGKINDATDPDGVASALTDGKAALDELPTDAAVLATAKTTAIGEVNAYVSKAITDASLSETDEAQKAVIDAVNEIKNDGITRINDAVSTESVEAIQHEIQSSVAAKIAEATQTVDEFKATAKGTINSHSTKQQENITDVEVKTAIAGLATAGCDSIDNYTATENATADKQEITKIMNATIDEINAKVAEYNLAVAKEEALSQVSTKYSEVSTVANALAKADIDEAKTTAESDINTATIDTIGNVYPTFRDAVDAIMAKVLLATTISFDGTNKITWSAVESATAYQVYVNDKSVEVTELEYVLDPDASGDYSIYVKAIATDYYTSDASNTIVLTATVDASTQKSTTLNLLSVTTSKDGTTLTANFKTAETIVSPEGVEFNVGASSSNMKIEAGKGLKFQKKDTSLSFATTDISEITIVLNITDAARTMSITSDKGLSITGITKGMTPVDNENYKIIASSDSSSITVVIKNAVAGTYTIKSEGDYTVYTTSIKIVAPKSVTLTEKETVTE